MIIPQKSLANMVRKIIHEKIRDFKNVNYSQDDYVDKPTKQISRFNIEELKKLIESESNLNSKVNTCYKYCAQRLQSIGFGSSRVTFVLTNRFVIKIALPTFLGKMKAGIGQNEHEVLISKTTPELQQIIPAIKDYDQNFIWVISDLVRPISPHEYDELFGMSYDSFYDLMIYVSRKCRGSMVNIERHIQDFLDDYSLDMGDTSLIKDLQYFMNINDLLPSDIAQQLGKTRDNRVVIYDYGFSEGVYQRHYR